LLLFVCVVGIQACILLALGAQCVTIETLSARLDLPVNQLLANFNKAVRKLTSSLVAIQVEPCRLLLACVPHTRVVTGGVRSAKLLWPQEASVAAEVPAASTSMKALGSTKKQKSLGVDEEAWEAALEPVAKRVKGDADVPDKVTVKKLVPVIAPKLDAHDEEDVEPGKHKHHKKAKSYKRKGEF
jgi:hypothetical protein